MTLKHKSCVDKKTQLTSETAHTTIPLESTTNITTREKLVNSENDRNCKHWLHGVESFMRSLCFPSYWRIRAIYGTRRFTTVLTRPRHVSLSWARSMQSRLRPQMFLKVQFRIIFPSPSTSSKWCLSLRFPNQISVCASPLPPPPICQVSAHHLLDLITRIIFGEGYKSSDFSLCSLL